MSNDIFSYQNNVSQGASIASSEFAQISMTNKAENALIQNFRANYGQQIEEVLQVGSPTIHWLPGRPSGSIDMGELVGSNGFFQSWQGQCGVIKTATVNMQQSGTCSVKKSSGSLRFEGGIIESLGLDLSVGRQTISQTARARVASMSVGSQ